MKKLYGLLVLTLMCTSPLFAQSFVFSPTNNYLASIDLNTYTNHQINIVNLTGGELVLGWETLSANMPEEWNITLCDYGSCNVGIPENGIMYPIFDTLSGFLKLSINPNNFSGTGMASFKVFDNKFPDQSDTVYFTIHAGNITDVNPVIAKSAFLIYPNPANHQLNFLKSFPGLYSVSLMNAQGRLLLQSTLMGKHEQLNVEGLEKGIYFVMISDQSGIRERKKIMIQ